MTSEYGRAKQDIKRARQHFNRIVERIGWLEEQFKDEPCFVAWFAVFKPYLAQADEALIDLLHMLVDPKPFNEELQRRDREKGIKP